MLKRVAAVAMLTLLILLFPWERLFSPQRELPDIEINSFEDIPETGVGISKNTQKSIAQFIASRSDEEKIAEIERLAEKYSTDKFKIAEVKCIPDHLAVVKGKRVTNYFSLEFVVEITPDNPDDGIIDDANEWKSDRGGMMDALQYVQMVCHESYTFVNALNGHSFSEETSQYNYLSNAPALNENEQKTFDIVNDFIAENYNEKGEKYCRLILQKLGIKDDELYIDIHFATVGFEENEIEDMFAEVVESLKADENVRAYMNGADKIRVYLDKGGTNDYLEYVFEV